MNIWVMLLIIGALYLTYAPVLIWFGHELKEIEKMGEDTDERRRTND